MLNYIPKKKYKDIVQKLLVTYIFVIVNILKIN